MKGSLLAAALLACFTAKAQAPYFQQEVNTKLEVRLDDKLHVLHGFEEFSYTNNSPDTLRYLYLHLWPNAYLHDHTPFAEQQVLSRNSVFYYSKPVQRGYIDSLDVTVDGKKVSLFSTDAVPDIARIDLPDALAPGGSLKLSTPFRVKIPKVFSRLGHARQAYYISQWFPKPAVYDNKGWHPISYLDQGEFYSEIGSYDVSITLPQNYVVMATGNCTDDSENAWLDSLAKAPFPAFTYPAKKTRRWTDSVNRIPPSSVSYKTIHFHEDKVHDFAFFADKRFLVRKDTIKIAGGAETVTAYAAFLPASKKIWIKGTDYIRETIEQLSSELGPYPYKTVKAVEGDLRAGGGMEYPTVTIIANTITKSENLRTIIVHEVGHNWFQGILASNERDHPWMDEGLNSFYEQKVTSRLRAADTARRKRGEVNVTAEDVVYHQGVAAGKDQPYNLSSAAYTPYNFAADVYLKTALHIQWLEGYMGTDSFKAAMQDYYRNWQHRHPQPQDFEAIMRQHSSRSLDWFFKDAVQNDRRIDFALRKVSFRDERLVATIVNRTAFAAPVRIDAFHSGKVVDSFWTDPFIGRKTFDLTDDSADLWRIGASSPDAKLSNNAYRKNGLFHGHGFKPGIGLSLNRAAHERVFLLPALGYNVYDGFMAGIVLHNIGLPEKNFRFALAPVYGFGAGAFSGTGSAAYFLHPAGPTFREIEAGASVKSFHYDYTDFNTDATLYARYVRFAPYLAATFRNLSATSTINDQLLLRGYFIHERGLIFNRDPIDSLFKPAYGNQENFYGLLRFSHRNDRLFNPYSYRAEAQLGADFAKLTLEGNLRIDYHKKGKSLYLRAFAGKYISISNSELSSSRYWLNTTYSGTYDYLYDDIYIARNEREGIFHRQEAKADGSGFKGFQQVSMREGGGKIPTEYYASPLGRSDDWLVALNLKTDLPLGKIPLRAYLDISTFSNAAKQNPSGDRFLYSGGLELHLLYDAVLINVPLVFSKDYNDYLKSMYPTGRLLNTVSFTLNLQNINWLKTISGFIKLSGG